MQEKGKGNSRPSLTRVLTCSAYVFFIRSGGKETTLLIKQLRQTAEDRNCSKPKLLLSLVSTFMAQLQSHLCCGDWHAARFREQCGVAGAGSQPQGHSSRGSFSQDHPNFSGSTPAPLHCLLTLQYLPFTRQPHEVSNKMGGEPQIPAHSLETTLQREPVNSQS